MAQLPSASLTLGHAKRSWSLFAVLTPFRAFPIPWVDFEEI